jgi:hypothetical protein
MEFRQAIKQGIGSTLERDNNITGYAADIGIFGHIVAKSK